MITEAPPPPHDEEAEAAVLGAVMLANAWMNTPEVFGLDPLDFYRPRHRQIWSAAKSLHATGAPIDAITVAAEMDQTGDTFDHATDYCANLVTRVVAIGNTKQYAKIVKDQSMMRALLDASHEIGRIVHERTGGPMEMVEASLRAVGSIGLTTTERAYTPDDLMNLAVSHFSQEKPTEVFPLPLPELNEGTNGGLRRGQVMAIAGWPNDGKSSFAMDCLESAVEGTTRTAKIYLTEMTVEEINHRIVARQTSLTVQEVIQGSLTLDQHRELGRLKMPNLTIQPAAGWTVDQICNDILRTKPDIVLVDHFHRINFAGHRNKVEAMDEASGKLNNVAKDNHANCVLLLVAHLSRPGSERESNPPRPTGRHLRGTQMLEADADIVCMFYRSRDKQTGKRLADSEAFFIRNRQGNPDASSKCVFSTRDLRTRPVVQEVRL